MDYLKVVVILPLKYNVTLFVTIVAVQLEDKIPILVLACNRVNVTRCLDLLIQYRPSKEKFPIIISQVIVQ